ncbi:MAG: SPFH domain-containing protein [Candidatus Harrisonbacteria bacterium]|nr:SPFH domain-containing protein [Candidatus Harrisonbacteria bacterium]
MFWVSSVVSTALYVLSFFSEKLFGLTMPWMNVYVWLAGVALSYALSGINIVNEWDRRPVLLFGRYIKTIGPGLCWVDPAFHRVLEDVSVQDMISDLKAENVQTKDNVRLNIIFVLTTRINSENVRKFVVEVHNGRQATIDRAVASVTETVSQHDLDHILHNRVDFSKKVKETLQSKVQNWGVEVSAVEIRDFKIADEEIERSVAMKAKALKEAEGELARSEMQLKIAEHLKMAAAAYDEETWRLKGFETLIELTRSAENNTVLIPTSIIDCLARLGAPEGMDGRVPSKVTPRLP